MNRLPDDQLSKAALKATRDMIDIFRAQRARLDSKIDALSDILRGAGISSNGHQPPPPAEKDPDAIVAKARARFAARKPARVARRSPAEWEAAIVQLLTDRGEALSALDIGEATGQQSNTFYSHIARALKKRLIVQVGTTPAANGHQIPTYTLTGRHGSKPAPRTAAPRKKDKRGPSRSAKDMRARSAALLAKYDLHEPRPYSGTAGQVGSLVRYGYLKQSGEGYVRTGKDYAVEKPR